MKSLYFLLISFAFHLHIKAQDVKGLYVDNFNLILGNSSKEDSLLLFAQNNNFNYLMLYNLHQIGIQTPQGSTNLTNFIQRAKSVYHIQNIGGGSENFQFVRDYLHAYNLAQADSSTRLDVYNLEFEFWNPVSVDTGGYYCQYYLAPNNLSCTIDGAFAYYKNTLTQIDSIAQTLNLKSEAYLGWFDSIQAIDLINTGVDRLFLHIYIPSATFSQTHQYNYIKDRLKYLGQVNTPVTVFPLYSSEPNFMQSWATTHDFFEPYGLLTNSVESDSGSWRSYLNIGGIQWFAYSFMPKKNMDLGLPEYGKGFKIARTENNYSIISNTEKNFQFLLMDTAGKLFLEGNAESPNFSVSKLESGIYLLTISVKGRNEVFRIVR